MAVPAPMPTSTANWHWKNKNVTKWGHQWFKDELSALRVAGEKEGEAAWIVEAFDVDGDIEVGQRKSKLITIFDCRFAINWAGTTSDGSEVKGRLDIPEVSHENTVDDPSGYAYHWSLNTQSTPDVAAIYTLAKSRLPGLLEAVFRKFPAAMLDAHGRDLTVSADPSRVGTPAASGTSTPASAPSSAPAPSAPAKKAEPKAINTSTVEVEATFAVSAADLFAFLTDEKKIPLWTRAPAQSAAKPDTEYTLFAGGVKGKYISLTPNDEIVQTWALASPTWPSGHTAQLTTRLVQGSDSTKVTFTLAGVPLGMEDEMKRNLEGYYIHGFKSIGYVQIVYSNRSSSPPPKSRLPKAKKRSPKRDSVSSSPSASLYIPVIAVSAIILAAAFSIPYLASSSAPPPPRFSS